MSDEVRRKIEEARGALGQACGQGRLTMSIPARGTDHDVVIARAFTAAEDRIAALEAEVERLRNGPVYVVRHGYSEDGRGTPKVLGWTADPDVADPHREPWRRDPYAFGGVEEVPPLSGEGER